MKNGSLFLNYLRLFKLIFNMKWNEAKSLLSLQKGPKQTPSWGIQFIRSSLGKQQDQMNNNYICKSIENDEKVSKKMTLSGIRYWVK